MANAGVESFEEISKLVFTKLDDERMYMNDETLHLKFRNSGDTGFK